MALWTIVKITNDVTSDVELDCVAPARPYQVTLKDKETGTTQVVALCATLLHDDPCVIPRLLSQSDFRPNDWETACPYP